MEGRMSKADEMWADLETWWWSSGASLTIHTGGFRFQTWLVPVYILQEFYIGPINVFEKSIVL
jgi:hypothetical protein